MAEAIFACKQIEEFTLEHRFTGLRLVDAKFPWFPKNFFPRDCPRYTGNWDCQNKQMDYLL